MTFARFRRSHLATGGLGLLALLACSFDLKDLRSEDRPNVKTVEAIPSANSREGLPGVLDRRLPSASGGSVTLRELRGENGTICVFLSSECPISNGYVPTMNQLAADVSKQGVKVVGINSNDGPSLHDLAAHRKEFAIQFPVVKDAGAIVASEWKVSHCPEAVILDRQGTIQYRGRIDDRYSRRGGAANDVQCFDLAVALQEVLAGTPVTVPETKVVGCPITRRMAGAPKSSAITYAEHVAPVLQKNCENCHREGGIGPFALQSYEQAASWADDIREFTANRQMPPWFPEDGAGDFHNRRVLSADEIALIGNWVESGCATGDLTRLPPPRRYSDDWTYGTPDLIVQTSESFHVPADGKDIYRCFVIPTDYDTDQFVQAVEVRPGNNRVVHHVIVFLDTTDRSQKLDESDPGPGYSTSAGFPGFLPSGGLGGWAPGNLPRQLPTGIAKVLPAKAKLVVQVHYHPSGKAEQDQTQIGVYFNKEQVTRVVRVIPVMPFGGPWSGMKIPAGDDNAEVRCSLTMPRDGMALNVTPHMHLLGKDMALTATLPDGTMVPLIKLQRWDFNWQESYQYREPITLPKGTRLDLVAHFDNSSSNPANPHHPPRTVKWGENTVDEMCIAFLEFVPTEVARSADDLKAPTAGELLREAILARFGDNVKPRRNPSDR
ncbi:MAG: redoxin domain-containing protein [Planctomycetes bacterium]|nr:redoxin domain-containing protein [Planctomycetota bacterium]